MDKELIEKQFTYHSPNMDQIERMQRIRAAARILAHIINENITDSADKSASIRLLREAVMTANAGIILNP